MRRRVTFSRNLTLSLSRTCRCHCKYCAFATHQPHLHEPAEVERLIDRAARRHVKELLVLTGEAPDHHGGVRARLAELGFADFTAYVVWACERALERGLLPHTNLGVLSRQDLADLRAVTASQGLMLESVNPDLVAHQGSPTKHPEHRLATIAAAQELRIPFTSGILVGIGESEDDRMAALEALAGFGNLQEVILQNFVPHRRYYGEEPAEIATAAADAYWRTGLHDGPDLPAPAWSSPVTVDDMERLVAEARRLVAAADCSGRHRPRRAERQRRPHLARAPVPVAQPGAQAARRRRRRADRAAVRLPALHGSRVARARRARRHQDALLELHPAARLGPDGGAEGRAAAGHDRARGRRGTARAGRADGAVRRDPARGDRGHAPGGRRAARRARRRHGHVRRQPQHQRLQRVHRRLRVLRVRRRAALARRLRARPR